jgi:hypothetical protein
MTAEPASKPAKTTAANRIIQVVFMATPHPIERDYTPRPRDQSIQSVRWHRALNSYFRVRKEFVGTTSMRLAVHGERMWHSKTNFYHRLDLPPVPCFQQLADVSNRATVD